jgi:hypothetical protein
LWKLVTEQKGFIMNKLLLARGYGLVVGLIALALGLLAWFDSVRFTQEAGIALGATDFGTLMSVKFIGNRNVSTGALILILLFMKQHRALGALLLVRGLIDLFDAFWLGMALQQGFVNAGTLPTLVGACVLTVLNFISGLYLVKLRDTFDSDGS